MIHPRRTRLPDVAEHLLLPAGRGGGRPRLAVGRRRGRPPERAVGAALREAGDAGWCWPVAAWPERRPGDRRRARGRDEGGRAFAFVSRRADDHGALRAGVHPGLLPGGRRVATTPTVSDVEVAWGPHHGRRRRAGDDERSSRRLRRAADRRAVRDRRRPAAATCPTRRWPGRRSRTCRPRSCSRLERGRPRAVRRRRSCRPRPPRARRPRHRLGGQAPAVPRDAAGRGDRRRRTGRSSPGSRAAMGDDLGFASLEDVRAEMAPLWARVRRPARRDPTAGPARRAGESARGPDAVHVPAAGGRGPAVSRAPTG